MFEPGLRCRPQGVAVAGIAVQGHHLVHQSLGRMAAGQRSFEQERYWNGRYRMPGESISWLSQEQLIENHR
jgi:hypothetical protein